MALFSLISLVTIQLYLAAQTEFEHSSGTMTLNQRARVVTDKITQILKTAVPVLNTGAEAFIHPNARNDMSDVNSNNMKDMYEADFMSTICFMPNPALGTPTWEITDPTCTAGYINDVNDSRYEYEVDRGLTSFVSRYPSLYRYRIAWNNSPSTPVTSKSRNIPPRAVYFERLSFGNGIAGANNGTLGWGEGPNVSNYVESPWIADTGSPYGDIAPLSAGMQPRIIGRNVHYLTFNRVSGNVILLRLKMYNRDPLTNIPVEGLTMRRSGSGGNRDAQNGGQRLFVVDITTNVQLPNTMRY